MSCTEFEIRSTARRADQEEYLPVEEHRLNVEIDAADCKAQTMVVTNNSDKTFKGVVEIEMVFKGEEPKFFMPAFLYNRNRGNVEPYRNKRGTHIPFPRLSLNPELEGYSDYWMVRADRLSHPVSIAVDDGKVYGISVQPTISQQCIFNGFTCHLGKEKSSVGITLGYENAPILYILHETNEERKKISQEIVLYYSQASLLLCRFICFVQRRKMREVSIGLSVRYTENIMKNREKVLRSVKL